VPPDDPSTLDPATLGTLDYRPVWQHARAVGTDAYADWYCHIYLGQPDWRHMSPDDLPDHPFARQWFPGDAARGQLDDGEPFTPAEVEARGPCERCGSAFEPAGAWHFDWGDGCCMRDVVCPGCGLQSCQWGAWDPPERQEPDDDVATWESDGTADPRLGGWDNHYTAEAAEWGERP
jgi:hypothetical protein